MLWTRDLLLTGAGICTIEGLIAKKTIRRCIQIIVILKEEIK